MVRAPSSLRGPAAIALLLLGTCWLLLTGVFGFKRENSGLLGGGFDFDYLYHAGVLWLSGTSPYDVAAFEPLIPHGSAFAYPPVIAPLCMLFGLLPHDAAEVSMIALNLVAATVMVFAAVEFSQDRVPSLHTTEGGSAPTHYTPEARRTLLLGTAVLAVFSPFVSHVVWMGQTSLIACALVAVAIWLDGRGRPALAGLALGFAMMKPQLSGLVALWLLLNGPWRLRVSFAVTVLVLVAWPLVVSSPLRLPAEYLASVEAYRGARFQQLEFAHMFGLSALFAALGVNLPSLAPLAALLFALCFWKRRVLRPSHVYALFVAASLLLVFSHDYDLCALVLAVPVFWQLAADSKLRSLLALAALGVLYLPQRGFRGLDVPLLMRTREFALLALTVALILLVWPKERAPRAATSSV